ncbi:hypothetical protein [Streptomyces sp. NBC_01003]|uniref:hypothetical protein n=1 Tax=Streptomyces sp. NBC_01003 TaxID=2903714 RepID=UPI0038660E2A
MAGRGGTVVDFSLRRIHSPRADFQAARLSAMVRCAGTSNVAAATADGLSAVGTMGDSYVEAFGLEEAAFRALALSHPGPVTLLADTHGNDRSMEYDERRTVE